jgi:hypothetical protein
MRSASIKVKFERTVGACVTRAPPVAHPAEEGGPTCCFATHCLQELNPYQESVLIHSLTTRFNSVSYVPSKGRTVVNDESERMWKEVVVASIQAPFPNSIGRTQQVRIQSPRA